jgi:hypothetical protein
MTAETSNANTRDNINNKIFGEYFLIEIIKILISGVNPISYKLS